MVKELVNINKRTIVKAFQLSSIVPMRTTTTVMDISAEWLSLINMQSWIGSKLILF